MGESMMRGSSLNTQRTLYFKGLARFGVALLTALSCSIASAMPVFEQPITDNFVSLEVENFHLNTPQGSDSWVADATAGASGSAMVTTPNDGDINNGNYLTVSPRLDFEVEFSQAGTYYVWVRGLGDSDGSSENDSVHVGFDNQAISTSDRMTIFNSTWTWSNATLDGVPSTMVIPAPGVYTVNIWMREDGLIVDKLVLSLDSGFVPTGTGPAETPEVIPSLEISPIGNQAVVAGDTLTVDVTATTSTEPLSAITLGVSNAPAGSSFSDLGSGVGQFTWTPTELDVGLYTNIDFDAVTPSDSASETISINVASAGQYAFLESGGLVVVEAEHYSFRDQNGAPTGWFLTPAAQLPTPDPDSPSTSGSSNGEYLEALPDIRVTHADPLIHGQTFYRDGGDGPILHYPILFTQGGQYFVRVRMQSSGGEDNGLHVGFGGNWPATGERIQHCSPKNQWVWTGKQRTEAEHCGVENMIWLDIPGPGLHVVQFSMREDGYEFDKFVLTLDPNYMPSGQGPGESPRSGGSPDNSAPQVYIGQNTDATTSSGITFDAVVADDGLPSGSLTYTWSVSGPVGANILSPNTEDTQVTFAQAGTYDFTLQANDGEFNSSADIEVVVTNDGPVVNTAPFVSAGADAATTVSAGYNLDATVIDDGLPSGTLTHLWTVSPSTGVSISSATSEDTAVSFTLAGTYTFTLTSDDTELTGDDSVEITVVPDGSTDTFSVSIGVGSDDAEESGVGNVTTTSSDLEMVEEGSDVQQVGVRFNGVNIAQGAAIISAYIQFQADETDTAATDLLIEGEDVDSALTFSASSNNISGRVRTAANVQWIPDPWNSTNERGIPQQTSDLAPIVQEIVDRPGWASGNAMAFLISGIGKRVADSLEGGPAKAAELIVEYSEGGGSGNTAPTVMAGADDSTTVSA
ncbi:MAG: hypothetical protein AAF420_04690, partial [Pseudomonadota bacterium]